MAGSKERSFPNERAFILIHFEYQQMGHVFKIPNFLTKGKIMNTDTNNSDLTQQRADLTARIAQAREDLNYADRNEIKVAQYMAELRSLAAGKGPRSARRKAAQDAQRFEAKMAKNIGLLRAQANALLTAVKAAQDALPGPDDEAH